ncbi:elongation factor P 5-aminopentanone reductase [Anaerocolumna sp. MB42-C2]|uniref:elongation factor P 5-aminopentanone reductase n=1 Tax=Anaerocolumna sp. MB42-C2 TaxID=3070997 RepID=UPI0027E0CC15|nr:3-oxoacyl-ACP reductase FabG [Anaerocolumna sp. MB42-C2]WMJ90316.1 3-oxoacyl-ACP reductase FabG [Anaerocolumna sp. MB42-C2]
MRIDTALVTGSSRGIGKAIALKFAKEGFNVIINCASHKEELLLVKEEIESCNVSCLAYLGDMGNYEEVKAMITLAKQQFGNIDILINNAGISHVGLFTDTDIHTWNRVIATNLTSVYNCCNLVVPDMIAGQKGKIINISSVWGSVGASCEVAYSASKGGINAFTKALAKELAPSNIQVNAVACGAIDTQMNHFLDEEELSSLIEDIPANRLGQTNEVADFVFQLAAGNNYLNGQIIHLDGAWI